MTPKLKLAALLLSGACTAGAAFEKVHGIDDVRIRRVVLSTAVEGYMAVASDNTLYISSDGGSTFRKESVLKDEQINHLSITPPPCSTLLMAGSRHGYRFAPTMERIFTADEGEQLNALIRHHDRLYAATSDGLYFSDAALLSWKRVAGLQEGGMVSLTGHGDSLYAVGEKGVFRLRPDGTVRRLFSARSVENGNTGLQPRQIVVDPLSAGRLWLGTNRGLFVSPDAGASWRRFYIAGADHVSINALMQPPLAGDRLYLCTDSGFFKVDVSSGTAESLTAGLPTTLIRWMDLSPPDRIYLATARGLFRSMPATPPPAINLSDVLRGEPSIQKVQSAALLYNSVDPRKTERWAKRLKYRALLPKLSVDYDKTIGYSVSSSGKYFGVGPYDWGLTVSWDMGDLLWNSYEDDVDNRSRLTTQLRMDILDEVNRLYYERLRLKCEVMSAGRMDEAVLLKQLRLMELTSTLDGYTGGLFSEQR